LNPFFKSLVAITLFSMESAPLCFGGVFSYSEAPIQALTEKANENDPEAQFWLGFHHLHGTADLPIHLQRAAELMEQAAEEDNTDAQAYWGSMLMKAQGVPLDSTQGMKWLKKAADKDHPQALFFLGRFHEQGQSNLAVDRFEAMHWYERAAEQGHYEAKINAEKMKKQSDQVRLGTIEPNWWELNEAALKTDAQQGNPLAQRHLGMRYTGCGGTELNREQACYWLQQAVDQNDLPAHQALAQIYLTSTNGTPEQAFNLCSTAAEQGERDAQLTLARLYKDGIGTTADRGRALDWYRKAHEAEHPLAAHALQDFIQGHASFEKTSYLKKMPAAKYTPPTITISIRDIENKERTLSTTSYDPENQTIEIEEPFGSTNTLPLAAFSADCQKAILNHLLFNAFDHLDLKIRRKRMTTNECNTAGKISEKIGRTKYKYNGTKYTLEFKIRGKTALALKEVECRFLYEKNANKSYLYKGKISDANTYKYRSHLINDIELLASDITKIEIPPFILKSYKLDSGYYFPNPEHPELLQRKPTGLGVRVTCEMACGTQIYRDFYEKPTVKSNLSW
jgi:TPR repeat protein